LAGALADANAALKLDPNHAKALVQRGVTYFMQKDLDNALADLSAASKIAPDLPAARHLRGILLAGRGEGDAALVEFDAAIKGEHARALADLEPIATASPQNANHRAIGLLHYYLGQYADSAAALERALKAQPDDPYSALWRFLAQSRSGKTKEARPALAEAAKALPSGKWPAAVVDFY